MEPAGLEQILRELLLPDTERIRRVRGRRDRARASRGLRERPDSDPQPLPRPLTHKFIHWLYVYYVKDPAIIDRIKAEMERMKEINKADLQ